MKNKRRARALKRERNKKILIAAIIVVVIAAFAFALIMIANHQRDNRVFTTGGETVTLRANGTFDAKLSHGNRFSGTYSESTEGGVTVILFTHDGVTVDGTIEGIALTIPHEWDDGHGHDTRLILK